MDKKILLALAIGVVIAVGMWALRSSNQTPAITTFQECADAGHPVMESYPRQCNAGGQTFVEEVITPSETIDEIRVISPLSNTIVTSPLEVKGEAKGTWYFEASFPISLYDSEGNELGIAPAQAQGEWMTEDFVPFSLTLTFANPATDTGVLVLRRDNPSGLPEHDRELSIPVRFR